MENKIEYSGYEEGLYVEQINMPMLEKTCFYAWSSADAVIAIQKQRVAQDFMYFPVVIWRKQSTPSIFKNN